MTVEETNISMTVDTIGNTTEQTMKPITILTILTKTMMLIIQQKGKLTGSWKQVRQCIFLSVQNHATGKKDNVYFVVNNEANQVKRKGNGENRFLIIVGYGFRNLVPVRVPSTFC